MLARQRQEAILAEARAHESVDIAAVARRLGVSEATVRRDLGVLAGQGHTVRVRSAAGGPGAAVGTGSGAAAGAARGHSRRPSAPGTGATAEQVAIAAAAAHTARAHMTIGLSGGPTIHKLAAHLRELPGLTLVTNSLLTAAVLSRSSRSRDRPTVILTGGYHDISDDMLHGPVTAMVLRSMRLELAFFDCTGLDSSKGATTDSLADCDARRALVQSAARTCVLATAAQCGSTSLSMFAAPDQIDYVVTAAVGAPSPAQQALLRRARGSVCVDLAGTCSPSRTA
ncbi:DeoR/GlpR family transcriptional regulator of sugar metabolism [Streptacidiphilus sp. MAP12-16]|uniref:DeoR/GlpR family DNA-binding transcription regulator n=1 Tax=Streptacidiphilus sp. MAP12-16 TaxID=3156300 RepID=UPI003519B2CF